MYALELLTVYAWETGTEEKATVGLTPFWSLSGQPPLPFGERTRDCSPGHAGKEGPQLARTGAAKSEGRFFFYVLMFRPPLAFICSWDKSLTPRCGSTALCQAQGPVRVSSLILRADYLPVVQPVLVSFTFSLFPNTKTISV